MLPRADLTAVRIHGHHVRQTAIVLQDLTSADRTQRSIVRAHLRAAAASEAADHLHAATLLHAAVVELAAQVAQEVAADRLMH